MCGEREGDKVINFSVVVVVGQNQVSPLRASAQISEREKNCTFL